jgi:hypothetical protein
MARKILTSCVTGATILSCSRIASEYNFTNSRDEIDATTGDDVLVDSLDAELHVEQDRVERGESPLDKTYLLIVFPEKVKIVAEPVVNQDDVNNEFEFSASTLVVRDTLPRWTLLRGSYVVSSNLPIDILHFVSLILSGECRGRPK